MERTAMNSQKQVRLELSFGTSIRSLAVILNKHFLTSFSLRNVSKDLKAVLASSTCPEDFPFVELMSDGLFSSALLPGTMGLTELLKRQMLTNKRWELWLREKRRCWLTHSIMTHLTASPTANSLSSSLSTAYALRNPVDCASWRSPATAARAKPSSSPTLPPTFAPHCTGHLAS